MTANTDEQQKLTEHDARRLEECVSGGGVAVFPTDTVYGVCCDPGDERAARRLYALKGRPAARPAAVMFFAIEPALETLGELDHDERAALTVLLPGPVTVLLSNPARRFEPACRIDPATLGLRVPQLPERLRALSASVKPVMQSSANLSRPAGRPHARAGPQEHPRRRRSRARRRRAPGHAIHRDRSARLQRIPALARAA